MFVPVFSRELNIVVGHHDVVSLRELFCSGILPLLHNVQVQWPVSVCRLCIYSIEMGHSVFLLHWIFRVLLLNTICFRRKMAGNNLLSSLEDSEGGCLISLK